MSTAVETTLPVVHRENTSLSPTYSDEKERVSDDGEKERVSDEGEKEETYDDHDVLVNSKTPSAQPLNHIPFLRTKPFPIDPDAEEETHQLTFRFAPCCALLRTSPADRLP